MNFCGICYGAQVQSSNDVITFEGIVGKVLTGRNGRDYAAMFEDKDWSDGLKMVQDGAGTTRSDAPTDCIGA